MHKQVQSCKAALNKPFKNYLKNEYEYWLLSVNIPFTFWTDQESVSIKTDIVGINSLEENTGDNDRAFIKEVLFHQYFQWHRGWYYLEKDEYHPISDSRRI